MSRLFRIGNRLINLDAVTHASYEPTAFHPAVNETWRECVVSFAFEDTQVFYNDEAEIVWSLLKSCSSNISPPKDEVMA